MVLLEAAKAPPPDTALKIPTVCTIPLVAEPPAVYAKFAIVLLLMVAGRAPSAKIPAVYNVLMLLYVLPVALFKLLATVELPTVLPVITIFALIDEVAALI